MKSTFVIGDVHGHYDRLKALLLKAKIIDENGVRINKDVEVIQLGDLGHFGTDSRGDRECYTMVGDWIDTVLWGNHDRALISPFHHFRGYVRPDTDVFELVIEANPSLWLARHGYILTHAGIHPDFKDVYMIDGGPQVDQIGRARGGFYDAGGILWRDDREPLWDGVKQIYGHSRGFIREHGDSYCIDTGGINDGNLAGIWLPDLKIVAVGEDAEINESKYVGE